MTYDIALMMLTIWKFIKKYSMPILSGILIGVSYIPFSIGTLWICYLPLFIYLAKEDLVPKETFIAGWLTQFVLTLIGFHWIAYTAHEFGSFPWVLAVITLLLFSSFMHIYIPIAVTFAQWIRQKRQLSAGKTLFVMALCLSLLERIWPSIFPWNLGYALLWNKNSEPIYNLADVIGFLGLSTLIFLNNATLALFVIRTGKRRWWLIAATVAVHIMLYLAGNLQKKNWDRTDSEVNFLAIQSNIGNAEKIQAEKGRGYQDFIVQKFLTDSKTGIEKFPQTDILIWPETAIPYFMDLNFHEHKYPQMIEAGFAEIKKPLLSGAYSKDLSVKDLDRSVFNALFLLDEQARPLGLPYRKTHLLAFGEYLPFSDSFPILLKWLPFVANFGRGHGPVILSWPRSPEDTVRFGGQICYEGLYPEFSRELAKKETQILVNVTNDSWFGKYFEPNQHMTMTFARAIETRRPLIRSTNTGITSAILANGDILEKSPTHETWVGAFKIKYLKSPPQTFYVLYGHWDWLLWTLLLVAIIWRGSSRARHAKS